MTRIVPLNQETHKSLKVDARAAAAYGDNQHFTHVIVNEFPQLVVHYPILFSKDRNTGEFYCGVTRRSSRSTVSRRGTCSASSGRSRT